MLASNISVQGLKVRLQVLLNWWVYSALFWCVGEGFESLSGELLNGNVALAGFWLKVIGWFIGGSGVLIFTVQTIRYVHAKRMGKVL